MSSLIKNLIILQALLSFDSLAIELESQRVLKVGGHPNRLQIADLDNDGYKEIIVSNHADASISIINNLGNNKELQILTYKVGENPTEFVAADMNNDNFLDLVIANHETLSFRVLLNNKNGDFDEGEAVDYPVKTEPHIHTLGVGDFNQDKVNDVVIDSWGNSQVAIYYLSNKGNYVGKPSIISVKEQPRTNLVVADIDADNLPDIVTPATRFGGVSIIFGKALESPKFVETASSPFNVAIADANSDGHQDILTVHRAGNFKLQNNGAVSVLLGSGKGEFKLAKGFPMIIKGAPSSVSAGDIDGNGWPEIITANYRTDDISVLKKDLSTNEYQLTAFPVGHRPESVVVADLDNDEINEVIVANRESNSLSILKFRKSGLGQSTRADK